MNKLKFINRFIESSLLGFYSHTLSIDSDYSVTLRA